MENVAGNFLAGDKKSIRTERRVRIVYAEESGGPSSRTVWPLALAFFDEAQVIVAWCELRQAFRHFRTDRLSVWQMTADRYPRSRHMLLHEWRQRESIPDQYPIAVRMKTYCYRTTTDVAAVKLIQSICDITHWPDCDNEIETTCPNGGLSSGARLSLKPKGGPNMSMEIAEASSPTRFVDLAHLPLATMRTSHMFKQEPSHTDICLTIEVWGPLGMLWDRLVARKQAAGAAAPMASFITHARQRSDSA